jgi:hypothetical protein
MGYDSIDAIRHSRGVIDARVLQACRPSNRRGRRESRMPLCTRSLACKWKKHTSKSTTGTPVHAGLPCAMVLRLIPRSPRRPGFVASVIGAMQSIVANLTPALACQDHTASPTASNVIRLMTCRVHRIPHSTSVTTRNAPPIEAGWDGIAIDLMKKQSRIFLRTGLDDPNQLERICEIDL